MQFVAMARGDMALCVGMLSLVVAPSTATASTVGHTLGGSSTVVVGNVRVQALSPTLLRVEPRGPAGWEDRATFMVVNRSGFAGVPLSKTGRSTDGATTTLSTSQYDVTLTQRGQNASALSIVVMSRSGAVLYNSSAWLAALPARYNKTLPGAATSTIGRDIAPVADLEQPPPPPGSCKSFGAGAAEVCQRNSLPRPQLLHWPSPLQEKAYALLDYPRFTVPEWGPMPGPPSADLNGTNGYDFSNNIGHVATDKDDHYATDFSGDTYIFILGDSLESWKASRKEFITLAGPTPVLPDFAFGTWFTYWHQYSYGDATSNISRWNSDRLPLDVWGLDMNWRNTTDVQTCGVAHNQTCKCCDFTPWMGGKYCSNASTPPVNCKHPNWYYDYPDTALFPNYTQWFEWIRQQKLRTYFNDHPFPVAGRNAGGGQTSVEEIRFRWEGLTLWLARGLGWWWYDHNWHFSIPPPFASGTFSPPGGFSSTSQSYNSGVWEGLDNTAWGSHIYFETVRQYNAIRIARGDNWLSRPMSLTKFGMADWRPNMSAVIAQESPAQHRFPVWWTGDGVSLQASVESMVNAGIHNFKPFVHSDCGGDTNGRSDPNKPGEFLRWTAHCALGTIHRFHGGDHRPWRYSNQTEEAVRRYLSMRYKLAPSLVAAGRQVAETGTPFVARCDLVWPAHATNGSADPTQYLFLNDTLVAPIFDGSLKGGNRTVWIPPGNWQDVWSGAIVVGPRSVLSVQPMERQPMWHRADGGLVVMTDKPELRIDEQDWSELTLEAFPAQANSAMETTRSVYTQDMQARYHKDEAVRTDLLMRCDGMGRVVFEISESIDGSARAWVVRVHLYPGQHVAEAVMDGVALADASVQHLAPLSTEETRQEYFPFGGAGSRPPANAGDIAQIKLPPAPHARSLVLTIT